jgi:hypothetical protein
MPQTLANGIKTPINADAYNLTGDLATMGNSANVVIPVANQAARDALTLYPGLCVCRLDIVSAPIERYDGTSWNGANVNTYTPVLGATTTNPTLGSGSQQFGNYILNGKMMSGQFFVKFGSGLAAGSGQYQISLPPGFTYNAVGSAVPLGNFTANLPTGAISGYVALSSSVSTNMFMWWQNSVNTQANITNSTAGWVSGNYFAGNFTIPIA